VKKISNHPKKNQDSELADKYEKSFKITQKPFPPTNFEIFLVEVFGIWSIQIFVVQTLLRNLCFSHHKMVLKWSDQ
jgi:hypothetical protein